MWQNAWWLVEAFWNGVDCVCTYTNISQTLLCDLFIHAKASTHVYPWR